MTVYANENGKETVRNAFYLLTKNPCDLFLVSPFFSNDELVTELLNRGCHTRLIVRLGPRTTPEALQAVISDPRIEIRYFTSPEFHSKLYIFGTQAALVGSANLTGSGVQSNREVAVEISSLDDRFERLLQLFQSYWDQAEVLTANRLKDYSSIYRTHSLSSAEHNFEQAIKNQFGNVLPAGGISVNKKKVKKEKIFGESYRREYQEFRAAFTQLQGLYVAEQVRKEPRVPLRIEIDQFFNFLRKNYCQGDEFKARPFLRGEALNSCVLEHLKEWNTADFPYLADEIPGKYSQLKECFSSPESIDRSTDEEVFQALIVCHAFHDTFRFFEGGMPTMKAAFFSDNKFSHVRQVLKHLIFGEKDFVDRMCDCIFDPDFKINNFGRSCVQELYGWANAEDVPICNGRTVKMLRYLGWNVRVFN
ncbi:MAG: NgoFVII family restriction endonuclease [Rhodospirillaceae bacterium]|nr:MAG: NgoFVII family restriction endonuclease [Rhodospirillaceae bacterium]